MAIDYKNPGELDSSLLSVPGMVDALKDYTLKTAHRPNEKLAFAGALVGVAHLMGRTYRDANDTRANLNIVALGGTAVGKEAARKTNKLLLQAIGADESLGDQIGTPAGLEDQLAKSPASLFQVDECDTFLGGLRTSGQHAGKLHQAVLEFYSESSSCHKMRALAGAETGSIAAPSLCLYGTAIPEYCYQAMNERSILDGLCGRFIFIQAGDFCRYGKMELAELPAELIADARYLWAREKAARRSGRLDLTTVPYDEEAQAAVERLFRESDDTAIAYKEKGLKCGLAMWARLPEKVLKLALVYAVSSSSRNPVITGAAIAWARRFVEHLTNEMLYNAQFWVSEGAFDRLKKRMLALLEERKTISRSELIDRLHVKATTFEELVKTLRMANKIELELVSRNKMLVSLQDD